MTPPPINPTQQTSAPLAASVRYLAAALNAASPNRDAQAGNVWTVYRAR